VRSETRGRHPHTTPTRERTPAGFNPPGVPAAAATGSDRRLSATARTPGMFSRGFVRLAAERLPDGLGPAGSSTKAGDL
jgi:hypothetical protein